MKKSFFRRYISVLIAAVMLVCNFPGVSAEEGLELTFSDITATDMTTMAGESKILVSINGSAENVSILQFEFAFSGDLKYKSIQYITGKNDPEHGSYVVSPDVSATNREKKFSTGIVSMFDKITLDDSTPLFILTFAGDPDSEGELSYDPESVMSYATVNGVDTPVSGGSVSMKGSETGVTAVDAKIDLLIKSLDADFYPTPAEVGYKSGIYITITDKDTGALFDMEIDFREKSAGGNHEGTAEGDEFLMIERLIEGHTFDVSVYGNGYYTYEVKDVNFDSGEPLRITSDDFVPIETVICNPSKKSVEFLVHSTETRSMTEYVCVYNSDGTLKDVKMASLSSGEPVYASLGTLRTGETRKIFVWDAGMAPATDAVK